MRRRLALTIAGVATAAVVLFAIPLGVVLERSYRDEELLRLQREAIAATRGIDVSRASPGDPVELPRSPDSLSVYDLRARRIAGAGPAGDDSLVRSALRRRQPVTDARGHRLVAAIPLLSGEQVHGVVVAARRDTRVEHDARRAWAALAGLGLLVVALAGAAAVLFGRRLSAPLERLAGIAGRLGSGDFSVRAPRAGVEEIDAVATALDTTAERLDDLVSRERAFSADASHQLRTPLAALRIELEAMELRGEPAPELAAALAQVERLESTIGTLLAVARGAHRGDAVTDLVVVVDEAVDRWRGALAAAGRPLRTNIAAERAVAAAAPGVVREILDVLLDNALRHGAGEATVTVRPIEGWLAVEVADAGAGFGGDPEEAFARRADAGGGHGIGLPLARSLAHAEGGRLAVTRPGPSPVVALTLAAAGESRGPRT
ncbi:MAG: hypothetical protein QOE06_319 [Thermoleophilaceae bacterium]|jgi:signal transduction histidine kinase|nr:hypothetical protein [Thermoleophilaceae bacterium]